MMLAPNLGLTKIYNLFNTPTCGDADIERLRELHTEMDRAVLACYGWSDLDLGHDFHQNDRGQTRFTISPEARREILRRLLALNLEIAAHEQAEAQAGGQTVEKEPPVLVAATVRERARSVASPIPMFPATAAMRTVAITEKPGPTSTPHLPSPRPPTPPILPSVPAPEKAFRERALKRALDLLAANPPLTGREIPQRLNQVDARIDRHLINSVLTHDGAQYVVHDAQTGRYRLKRG
jgi:hypothetical protein